MELAVCSRNNHREMGVRRQGYLWQEMEMKHSTQQTEPQAVVSAGSLQLWVLPAAVAPPVKVMVYKVIFLYGLNLSCLPKLNFISS